MLHMIEIKARFPHSENCPLTVFLRMHVHEWSFSGFGICERAEKKYLHFERKSSDLTSKSLVQCPTLEGF